MDDDDLDEVLEDGDQPVATPPQSFTNGQFHGVVRTAFSDGDSVLNTWNTLLSDNVRTTRISTCKGTFGPIVVDYCPVHNDPNEPSKFTMSPLTLSNYRTMKRCLVSRIQRYCTAQHAVALNGWWAVGTLDLTNKAYNFDTVYLSISGTMCSFSILR